MLRLKRAEIGQDHQVAKAFRGRFFALIRQVERLVGLMGLGWHVRLDYDQRSFIGLDRDC